MNMPFPVSQIPLDLTKDTPTKVDVAELRQELNAIGLTCRETTLSRLEKSKNEVLDRISDGEFEGFQFYHTADKAQIARHVQGGKPLLSLDQVVLLDGVPHAEWKPSSTVPFSELLYAVGQPGHFDLLKEQYLTFPGQESNQTYTGQRTTVEAIKDIFVEIANNIASAIVTGLNKPLMEAALANILRPVPEGATNYDSGLQNRSILLVTGYDGKYAQGIGVVNVEYRLQIKDYKEKKKGRHNESTLNVAVRAVTYTELKELEAEVAFLKAHLKNRMFVPEGIPVPDSRVTVYKDLPAACYDTFIHALPLEQTENDILPVLVLFGPDLENVGFADNTGSKSSVSYSKTITSGFTSSLGFKLGAGIKMSAGVVFAKSEVTVNMEISFTAQWNTSQSETITYTIPGGEKAYLYQGCLHCAVLTYNVKTMQYHYDIPTIFRTNIIKTTEKSIDGGEIVYQEPVQSAKESPLWETLGVHADLTAAAEQEA